MKTWSKRSARTVSWTALIAIALGFGVVTAVAQLSRKARILGVKFPQFYEGGSAAGRGWTNRLKGLLLGTEGRYLSNEVVLITTMRLEHYDLDGRTNLVARAPECLFDSETQVAWSTGRLELVGMDGLLQVRGNQGFQLRMTNSSMTISNRVRTTLRQSPLP